MRPEDVRIDHFSAGVGSSHHVRVTHLPTGKQAAAMHPSYTKATRMAMTSLELLVVEESADAS